MRKIILVLVALAVFIGFSGNFSNALAVELCPILRLGTINLKESGINEGHKFLRTIGVRIKSDFADDGFSWMVGGESWRMGEPLDEDTEIPTEGYNFSGEIGYNWLVWDNFIIYPYAGLGLEKWKRDSNGNMKYSSSWNSLEFFTWSVGGGVIYKKTYLRAGLLVPFQGRTNDNFSLQPGYGLEFEAGMRWKRVSLCWHYRRLSFDQFGSENTSHPGFELNRHGLSIEGRFHF